MIISNANYILIDRRKTASDESHKWDPLFLYARADIIKIKLNRNLFSRNSTFLKVLNAGQITIIFYMLENFLKRDL